MPSYCQAYDMLQLVLPLLALGLAEFLHAQTLADIGFAAPIPGSNDIYQLLHQRRHGLAGRVAVQ
jgi:hypothetical protein